MTGTEVLTMGRISVDLYPEQIGVALPDVRTFRKMLGGSATNVAVAAARLGNSAGVITKVGDDPFGVYARRALDEFRVDASRVGTHPTLRTPIVFCEIFPPDRFPLLFYRQPTAPDMTLEESDLDLEEIAGVPLFWTTGTGLSAEPSRTATLAALDARRRRPITVHDLDHRPMFWSSDDDAGKWGREAVSRATVAVGGRTEAVPLVGDRPPADTAAALLDLGVDLAVVKLGAEGVVAATADEQVVVPPIAVEVVNGLGAGDAFGGALCHGLLSGWELERTIRFANAAGRARRDTTRVRRRHADRGRGRGAPGERLGEGRVDGHAPLARRPRHHVQVVEVVARARRHGVVAPRHEHDLAVADGDRLVDRAVRRVDALERETVRRSDAVVVGLLEIRLARRVVDVVLVRRIAGPVAGRRDDLRYEQGLGRRLLHQDVVDLARLTAAAARLVPHVLRCEQAKVGAADGRCGADGELERSAAVTDHSLPGGT